MPTTVKTQRAFHAGHVGQDGKRAANGVLADCQVRIVGPGGLLDRRQGLLAPEGGLGLAQDHDDTAAGFGNAAQIVSCEVNEHNVFSTLLRVRQ